MIQELINHYCNEFYKDGEISLYSMIKNPFSAGIILSYYHNVEPLESLPRWKVQRLYLYAEELFPNEKDRTFLTKAVKIIHTIGTLL